MTRINASIPVEKLCDEHLLAEHREIKRIPNTIKSGKAKVENIPNRFKLGAGHVKFFYDKLLFLKNRYNSLYNECVQRGFNVTNYATCFKELPPELCKDHSFTNEDNGIVVERISERLSSMKNIHYKGVSISSIEAIELLR